MVPLDTQAFRTAPLKLGFKPNKRPGDNLHLMTFVKITQTEARVISAPERFKHRINTKQYFRPQRLVVPV